MKLRIASALLAAEAIFMVACSHNPPPVAPIAGATPASTAPAQAQTFAELQPVAPPLLRSKWTPEELSAACQQAMTTADAKLAAIVAVPPAQRSFANTFGAFEAIGADFGDSVYGLGFMKDIHPDPKVREAGAACEENAGKFLVRTGARRDVYLALKGWLDAAKPALSGGGLPRTSEAAAGENKTLVTFAMRDFHRNGLDLSDADREKLVKLRSRLAELQTQFARNIAEDKDQLELTAKELDGFPKAFIDRLKKAKSGKLVVTTAYPDYYPVMENCKVAATRRKMETMFMNRGGAGNAKLLDEAIALRDQSAKLLGYATHVDYVTEVRMAKNAKTVEAFEAKIRAELKPRLAADTAQMKALKEAETHEKNPTINAWDWRYYLNQLKKKQYAIDDEAVRAYFPVDKVMHGLFEVYSTLFDVEFKKVEGAEVWSSGVALYETHDKQTGRLLAEFYIDMFPRAGKYSHAACFPTIQGRALPSGYQAPLAILVVNFDAPQGGQPAHLSIDEVDTLFHEFGHVMHNSLTTARYATLSGSNVSTDFVEAPSQMLENWVFESEVLKLVSQDPKDPAKSMPEDLVKRIIAARKFDSGVKYSRQVFLGTFDYRIHSQGAGVSSDAVAKKTWDEVLGFPQDASSHFASGFGHMMGGYDAGYYGYLWSEVYSSDMFTRFAKEGVLNPQTGRDYRNIILAKGHTEEADQLLREFLGRDANETAFLKMTGIQ